MTPELTLEAGKSPLIEGQRIYLRRLVAADVSEAYRTWMNTPDINRYLESRFTNHSLESLHDFVAANAIDLTNLLLGIFLKDDDRHIGNIKLGSINVHHARGEIGLLIGDRACWGHGFASEAIGILTDFAFDRLGLRRVTAGAYADNEGSSRAFEKCGYLREGILRDHWFSNGTFQDGIYLGITRHGRNPA